MAHTLGVRRIDLYLQFERTLSEAELQPYRELTARRGRGEPVAYLVGRKEFMKLDFEVTPDVLVPNPDTEALVVRAIELLRTRGEPARVADVGTGSGCIAVSLAHYVSSCTVCAGDVSAAALAVAARNVERHGAGDRVRLVESDLLEAMPGPFELICANLPYLPAWADLPADVRAQPPVALFGGEDGDELVRRLLETAPARLAAGGVVLAEADEAVFDRVAPVVALRYAGHRMHRDLGGHPRVVEAWLAGGD